MFLCYSHSTLFLFSLPLLWNFVPRSSSWAHCHIFQQLLKSWVQPPVLIHSTNVLCPSLSVFITVLTPAVYYWQYSCHVASVFTSLFFLSFFFVCLFSLLFVQYELVYITLWILNFKFVLHLVCCYWHFTVVYCCGLTIVHIIRSIYSGRQLPTSVNNSTCSYAHPHTLNLLHMFVGKAIPVHTWTGPQGSRRLRIQDNMTINT
jgi:hypothetical protein